MLAALEDDRFDPITPVELPYLQVTVSLLVNFKAKEDHLDSIIGRHGVKLELTHKKKTYEATFLPEVMAEEKWDQLETMNQLLEKAEFTKGDYNSVKSKIKITTYESKTVTVEFSEYLKA